MKILHIEPDETYRKEVSSRLTAEGYTVSDATNALDALDMLLSKEMPDLVVCNAILPDTSGITLLHNIRGVVGLACAKLPFIITYSNIGGKEWLSAMRMDVEYFIPKFGDPNLLLEAIRDTFLMQQKVAKKRLQNVN